MRVTEGIRFHVSEICRARILFVIGLVNSNSNNAIIFTLYLFICLFILLQE